MTQGIYHCLDFFGHTGPDQESRVGVCIDLLQRIISVTASEGPELIDEAMESENPKIQLVELVFRAQSTAASAMNAASAKPHFGSGPTQQELQASPSPAPQQQRTTKHVMLSYQWDQQKPVKRVHELLTKLGFKCWMDVFGGMGEDIYDSMAEGVSNASVVVCFMSQKYQESDNCKLECEQSFLVSLSV